MTLPPEFLEPYLKKAAQRLSRESKIKGFRPGKVPYEVMCNVVGEEKIWQEAIKEIIPRTYVRVVTEHKLEAIGKPQVEITKLAPGNPLEYVARVAVVPDVELPDYKKIRLKPRPVKIEDKEIEQELQTLRRMRASYITVTRGAEKGDRVEIDFELKDGAVPLEGGSSKRHPVWIGEGQVLPALEKQLIGMREGETKTFELTYPTEYFRRELSGRTLSCKVTMKLVQKMVLPELNDEFARNLGKFKDLKDLRTKLRENIKAEKEREEEERFEHELVARVTKQAKISALPAVLVEAEEKRLQHNLEQDLKRQGRSMDDFLSEIKKTKEDFRAALRKSATRAVRTGLVLRAIARAEKITVTPEEIQAAINARLRQYASVEQAKRQVNLAALEEELESLLRIRKTVARLKQYVLANK